MSLIESEASQTRLAIATLFACTVRTLAGSDRALEEDWIVNLMTAYNELRERGEQNLAAMETLSWAMSALQELRKS